MTAKHRWPYLKGNIANLYRFGPTVTLDFRVTGAKPTADTIAADVLFPLGSSGSAVSASITETATASEASSASIIAAAATTETATASEAETATIVATASAAEAGSASAVASATALIGAAAAETAAPSETGAATYVTAATITETASATDFSANGGVSSGGVTETGSPTDTESATLVPAGARTEAAPAPGGGYAPWEHKRLAKHERDAQKRKREEERRTIAELEAAYDRAQGLAIVAEAPETPAEAETLSTALSVANSAILEAKKAEAEQSARIDALLADLLALAADLERRIAEEEDDDDFLMMVA